MDPLLNVEDVRKQLRIARERVFDAMRQYSQTDGEIGLRFVVLGRQRRTRAAWVDDWLEREANRSVAM